MCPLRVILIFLSAAVAGFFVLRSLKEQQELDDDFPEDTTSYEEKQQLPLSTKARSAISTGFWTCVDMASGRYLWRILVDPAAATAEKKKNQC